jgi:hypothetical protein
MNKVALATVNQSKHNDLDRKGEPKDARKSSKK